MARPLSLSGEEFFRESVPEPFVSKLIDEAAAWEPRPPRSRASTGRVPMLTERAKELFRGDKTGEELEQAERLIAETDEWARQVNEKNAGRSRTTIWTPERLKAADKSTAERSRRYRARQREARRALAAQSTE